MPDAGASGRAVQRVGAGRVARVCVYALVVVACVAAVTISSVTASTQLMPSARTSKAAHLARHRREAFARSVHRRDESLRGITGRVKAKISMARRHRLSAESTPRRRLSTDACPIPVPPPVTANASAAAAVAARQFYLDELGLLAKLFHSLGGDTWHLPDDAPPPHEPRTPLWFQRTGTDGANFTHYCWHAIACTEVPLRTSPGVTTEVHAVAQFVFDSTQGPFLRGVIPPEVWAFESLEVFVICEQPLVVGAFPTPPALTVEGEPLTLGLLNVTSVPSLEPWTLDTMCGAFEAPYLYALIAEEANLEGAIPSCIGAARGLQYLYVINNRLSGPVPDSICRATHLKVLALAGNRVTDIPECVGELHSMEDVLLGSNELTTLRPGLFGDGSTGWPLVQHVALDRNPHLSGSIPADRVATMRSLIYLGLSETSVHGTLPATVFNSTNIVELSVFSEHGYGGGIVGTLPSDICTAAATLQALDVSGNPRLTGTLPQALASMTRLTYVSVHSCGFVGAIPRGLGSPTRLWQHLDVTGNRLRDNLTAARILSPELTGYVVLGLAHNDWSLGATLPPHVPRYLRSIDLSYAGLVGSIPEDLWRMASLQVLSLDGNRLTRTLPDFARQPMPRIQGLGLNNLMLTGSVPDALWTMSPDLMEVGLAGSAGLTGSISPNIGNATKLDAVTFVGCDLEGSVPQEVWTLPKLSSLGVGGNPRLTVPQLPDMPPATLGVLDLSGPTTVMGTLPPGFLASPTMASLNVSGSGVGGKIGVFARGPTCDITAVDVSHNPSLSGSIPADLGNCSGLSVWASAHSNVGGSVPGWLATAPSLTAFVASASPLRGSLPDAFHASLRLQSLFLSGTHLHGATVPASLGNLRNLTQLTMAGCGLAGHIPPSLSACTSLRVLDLSHNPHVQGVVPDLSRAAGLQTVRLAAMALGGTMPSFLASAHNLTRLELELNSLSCEYPDAWRDTGAFPSLWRQGEVTEGAGASGSESCVSGVASSHSCGLAVASGNIMACPTPAVVSSLDAVSLAQSCYSSGAIPTYAWRCGALITLLAVCVAVALVASPSAWSERGWGAIAEAFAVARRPQEWCVASVAAEWREVAALLHLATRTCLCGTLLALFTGAVVVPINLWARAEYECRFEFAVTMFGVRYDLSRSSDGAPTWLLMVPSLATTAACLVWVLRVARTSRAMLRRDEGSLDHEFHAGSSGVARASPGVDGNAPLGDLGSAAAGAVVVRAATSGTEPARHPPGAPSRMMHRMRNAGTVSAGVLLATVSLVATVAPTASFILLWSSVSVFASTKEYMLVALAAVKSGVNEVVIPPAARTAVQWCGRIRRRQRLSSSSDAHAERGFMPSVARAFAHDQDVRLSWTLVLSVFDLLVVPLALVLLLDRRCLWYFWTTGPRSGTSDYEYSHCAQFVRETVDGMPVGLVCTDVATHYISETYEYPLDWDPACASAIVELLGPILLQTVVFQGTVRPAVWIVRAIVRRWVSPPRKGGGGDGSRLAAWARSWVHKEWHHSLVERYSELIVMVVVVGALGPAYPPLVAAGLVAVVCTTAVQCLLSAGPLVAARNTLVSRGRVAAARAAAGVGDSGAAVLFRRQYVRGVTRSMAITVSIAVLLTHGLLLNTGAFSGTVVVYSVPVSAAAMACITLSGRLKCARRAADSGSALHPSRRAGGDVALLDGATSLLGGSGDTTHSIARDAGSPADAEGDAATRDVNIHRAPVDSAAGGDYRMLA